MKPVLLMGIGNTLRQDDGAGAAVALRFHQHPVIESFSVIQLLPEHVERFRGRQHILFVDAAINCREVSVESLTFDQSQTPRAPGHVQQPSDLLRLYQWLYEEWPPASLVSVPAINLEYGEELSSICRQGVEEAVQMIVARLEDLAQCWTQV